MHTEKNKLNFEKQRIPRVCRNPCLRKKIFVYLVSRKIFSRLYLRVFCLHGRTRAVQDVYWTRRVCAAVAAPRRDDVLS